MAEQNGKKKGRRAYLQYFTRTLNGYEYTGPVCRCQNQPRERKRLLRQQGGCCTVMAAATVIAGCMPAPGTSNCFYVLLPYLWVLTAVILTCWAFGQLAGGGEPMRRYVYDRSLPKLPVRLGFTMAGAALTLTGEMIYLLMGADDGKLWAAMLFMVCQGGILAAAFTMRRLCARMRYEVED